MHGVSYHTIYEMVTFDYVTPYPCPTGRFNLFVVATSPIQPGEVDVVLRYWPKWSKYVEMHHILQAIDAPTINLP
jgi:hypothetical protein